MRFLTCSLLVLGLSVMVSCYNNNSVIPSNSASGNPAPSDVWASQEIKDSTASEHLAKAGSETGLPIPAGTRLIHFTQPDFFVDPVWVAKIVIPTSSYKEFEDALLAKETDAEEITGTLSDSIEWWKPANVVLTKIYWLEEYVVHVRVVVSEEGEEYAVYIECTVI